MAINVLSTGKKTGEVIYTDSAIKGASTENTVVPISENKSLQNMAGIDDIYINDTYMDSIKNGVKLNFNDGTGTDAMYSSTVSNGTEIFAATRSGFWISPDGEKWKQVFSSFDTPAITGGGDNNNYLHTTPLVKYYNGLWFIADGGGELSDFKNFYVFDGTEVKYYTSGILFYDFIYDGTTMHLIGSDGYLYQHTLKSGIFERLGVRVPNSTNAAALTQFNGNLYVSSNQNATDGWVMYTSDFGATWTSVSLPGIYIYNDAQFIIKNNILFITGSTGYADMAWTTDGITYTISTSSVSDGRVVRSIDYDGVDYYIGYGKAATTTSTVGYKYGTNLTALTIVAVDADYLNIGSTLLFYINSKIYRFMLTISACTIRGFTDSVDLAAFPYNYNNTEDNDLASYFAIPYAYSIKDLMCPLDLNISAKGFYGSLYDSAAALNYYIAVVVDIVGDGYYTTVSDSGSLKTNLYLGTNTTTFNYFHGTIGRSSKDSSFWVALSWFNGNARLDKITNITGNKTGTTTVLESSTGTTNTYSPKIHFIEKTGYRCYISYYSASTVYVGYFSILDDVTYNRIAINTAASNEVKGLTYNSVDGNVSFCMSDETYFYTRVYSTISGTLILSTNNSTLVGTTSPLYFRYITAYVDNGCFASDSTGSWYKFNGTDWTGESNFKFDSIISPSLNNILLITKDYISTHDIFYNINDNNISIAQNAPQNIYTKMMNDRPKPSFSEYSLSSVGSSYRYMLPTDINTNTHLKMPKIPNNHLGIRAQILK